MLKLNNKNFWMSIILKLNIAFILKINKLGIYKCNEFGIS
jgi:hypothetical protein